MSQQRGPGLSLAEWLALCLVSERPIHGFAIAGLLADDGTLLDRELAAAGIPASQLPGYHTRAAGHLHLAAAIAAGLADAGIASEPAARAYDVAFIPLAAEHLDLVIPARLVSTPRYRDC